MAYFDNAATTFPKPEIVHQFMHDFYKDCGGSYGRGAHTKSLSSGKLVKDTRERLNNLFHCPARQVVFTSTATIALNIVIAGLIESGLKNIYISPFEHNAVTRVLHHYENKYQVLVKHLAVSENFAFDFTKIREQFEVTKPDIVIMSHASNVIGLVLPVDAVCALAKKYDAVTVIDMAQTAGLVDLELNKEYFDFAVFAGHKTLLGPTGIAGFVMKPEFDLPATIFGGTGFDSANQDMPESVPERFEMGTHNIVGIAGLNAALRWIEAQSISKLWDIEQNNRERLLDILSQYSFLQVVGLASEQSYVGIVSCLLQDISSDSAAMIFNERGIAVRAGLQCAPLTHKFLGTYPAGTIRFSVSALTTEYDFDELVDVLESIAEAY